MRLQKNHPGTLLFCLPILFRFLLALLGLARTAPRNGTSEGSRSGKRVLDRKTLDRTVLKLDRSFSVQQH